MPYKFVSDSVRHHAQVRPGKTALIYRNRVTSYADLDGRSNRVANGLLADGLDAQARIAILANNSDRFFEIWLGASRASLVLTPLNFRLAPDELRYILADSQARALFVGREYADLVDQIASDQERLTAIRVLDEGDEPRQDYESWIQSHDDSDPQREQSETDTVIQYYSSGTTGLPKGVEMSHANILRHTPVWLEENGHWDETDISLVPMPLFHVGGSAFGNAALLVGGTNVVMPQVDPHAILEAIGTQGITRLCVVPAVIQLMLKDELCERTDFSSVRRILYGGSPMPRALAEQALRMMGPRLEQTYGTTETCGGFTRLSADDHTIESRLQSCGKPMPYVDVRVVDEDGQACAAGSLGEIIVRGDCVMKGYWRAAEATARSLCDGWFHTGDAGYFDDDGYLYIFDRLTDMIVTGGENVYPAEVERILLAHPRVADVAVFGVPDEDWGEAVKAVVICTAGHAAEAEEIIDFCRTRIAHYKCPKTIDFVNAIPRNATGKILKRELRKPFWVGYERRVN